MSIPDIQSIKQRFGIIGNSQALNLAIEVAVQVAPTNASVLITGESGVGKESFSQIIHQYSHRKHGPYIAVNCGAIPEGTIDSELFGHEKGSFTGAVGDRKGYFEVADKGTIFLDEVGELPLSTQVRLLRVLETGEFIKVGSSKSQKTDVRVVAATNLDMQAAIQNGRFREDLYYRLNTIHISVPPLRKRKEDIVVLFKKFASDFATKYRMPAIQLTKDAQELLLSYYFPGNIRQLRNIAEQISIIEQNREIDADCLEKYLPDDQRERLPAVLMPTEAEEKTFVNEREILYQVLFDMRKDMNDMRKIVQGLVEKDREKGSGIDNLIVHNGQYVPAVESAYMPGQPTNYAKDKVSKNPAIEETAEYEEETLSLDDMEREVIRRALEKHKGKRKESAEELKISERTLYRKIKAYKL